MQGKVYLLGAGSGDLELITLKALNCLKKADVVIYDSLINKKILSFANKKAEMLFVGKRCGKHSLPQEEINSLLLDKALEHKTIVRLKGGDPFIFGRGGEEALFLNQKGIIFEIISGVSSYYSAAAYAGIPVTHRGISSSFHVISGHNFCDSSGKIEELEILAKLKGTLIFLMGLSNIKNITETLIKFGKSLDTPAAVILNGTMPSQITIVGTLENISQKYDECKDNSAPGVIIVGEVVNLRENLCWFEKKPLWSRKIIVTRAKSQNRGFLQKIEELGAEALEFPVIEINPIADDQNIVNMYKKLALYDWIVFTSVNAVEIFIKKLISNNLDIRDLGNAKLCAIGEATAEALEKKLLKVEIMPDEFVSESFAETTKANIKEGERVLMPCAEDSREILSAELSHNGILIDVVHLYETVLPEYDREELKTILDEADSITFTSSSTVINFLTIMNNERLKFPHNLKVYCLGPITSETATKNNINVYKTADEYTIDELINVLTQ